MATKLAPSLLQVEQTHLLTCPSHILLSLPRYSVALTFKPTDNSAGYAPLSLCSSELPLTDWLMITDYF